jgi:glycosyltransferase involved in cell wall biosynthesis
MKKVLLVVPSLNMGGMERMLVNVANVLVSKGNDVTVLNTTGDDPAIVDRLDERVHYHKYVVPVKFFLHASLQDYLHGKVRFLPYKYWMKVHSSQYLHKKYVKESYETEIAFYTGYPVKIVDGCPQNTRKIFWLHGEAWQMDGMIQGYWHQKRADEVYKNFDQIVCVSNRIEQDFRKRFGNDCCVTTIPNINDVEQIYKLANKEKINTKDFTFVLVGRVDNQHKGFDRVLTAAKRLHDEGYHFDVWVVGNGKDFEELQKQKADGDMSYVTLWGQQENPYQFIKSADVFICSSHYEGYGLVVSEALILEQPVLSSDVSGPAEILDHGKYGMVVENSEKGLYQGMKAFLDKPELKQYYQQRAKERKDFFDVERISNMIQAIL